MSPARKRKSSATKRPKPAKDSSTRKSSPAGKSAARVPVAKKPAAKKAAGKQPAAKKSVAKKAAAKQPAAKKSVAKKAAGKQPVAKQRAANRAPAKPPQSAPYETGKWAAAFAPRAEGEVRYWLLKSEPETFSFDDLVHAKDRTTHWDGVRNFAARNFLRDGMKLGDQAFYYHSSTNPQAIVGICEVVREGYPDHTAFERSHHGYDANSSPDTPTWYMVDVRAVAPLAHPVTLPELKTRPELAEMALLRIGRLSVTPVTAAEWKVIVAMGKGGA
ncbi:MAG TPA: EVE domain-containing protein [Gemmatimonadaceae bacterium]|nr:EVE domain-containing protein [Gemmatimonadaceae bacterium]